MSTGNPNPGRRSLLLFAVIIYALALGTRLAFLAQAIDSPVLRIPVVDERINWQIAERILEGDLTPIAYVRAPGYVYALAGIVALVRSVPFDVRVAQVFIDALSPVLMLLIGVRCFGLAGGIVAGVLGAVYWTCVFFSCQLLDASPSCLLCLGLAYLLVRLPDARWWKWLGCGLVAGLTALVRPPVLAFVPILAMIVFFKAVPRARRGDSDSATRPSGLRAVAGALLLSILPIIGCALAVFPVSLRNRIVGGEWVMICVSGGANFWIANNPASDGKDLSLLVDEEIEPRIDQTTKDPWQRGLTYQIGTTYAKKKLKDRYRIGLADRLYRDMFVDYVRHYPGKFVRDVFKRFCWLFNAYEYPNNKDLYEFFDFSSLLRALSRLHFGIVCPLALVGIVLSLRRASSNDASLACYLALIVALVAVGVLFVVNARYRQPMVCLLIPFAGYAAVRLSQMAFRPRSHARGIAVAVGALVGLGIFCNANLFGYRAEHRPLYLDWFFINACEDCGDQERLAQAVPDFGARLAAQAESLQTRPTLMGTIQRYGNPFGYLMSYAYERGNRREALRYAALMLRHERFNLDHMRQALELYASAGDHAACLRILRAMDQRVGDAEILADAWARFGESFKNAAALNRADGFYGLAIRAKPGKARLRVKRDEVRRLIRSIAEPGRPPSSATTRSSP